MSDQHTVVKLLEPLPCGIRKSDVTCGEPAQAAHVWRGDPRVRGGELVMLPVCRACALAAAAMYDEKPPPAA